MDPARGRWPAGALFGERMGEHVVKQGECILSLAARHGFAWEALWDAPENRDLRKKRKVPNILHPGDAVFIPEKAKGEESGATEQRHRFRRLGGMVELRVRVHDLRGPRKGETYHVEIDKKVFKGETSKTDGEGLAVVRVPATATRAELIVGEKEDVYLLLIGHMDPIDTVAGLHARLENLGYDAGGVGSAYDERSCRALSACLFDAGEAEEGRDLSRPDVSETQDALKKIYGT